MSPPVRRTATSVRTAIVRLRELRKFNSPTEVVDQCPEGCDLHETKIDSTTFACSSPGWTHIVLTGPGLTRDPRHPSRQLGVNPLWTPRPLGPTMSGTGLRTSPDLGCCVTRPSPRIREASPWPSRHSVTPRSGLPRPAARTPEPPLGLTLARTPRPEPSDPGFWGPRPTPRRTPPDPQKTRVTLNQDRSNPPKFTLFSIPAPPFLGGPETPFWGVLDPARGGALDPANG